MLAKQSSIDDMDVRYDSSVAEATHEQLGSLPGFWNLRVRLAPMRCARMTLRGSPCHVIVLTPGAPCRGTPPLRGTDDRGVSARRLRTAARVLTVRGAHHPAPHQRRVGHHPPRMARWLEKRANMTADRRIRLRDNDPEAYVVLTALHLAALRSDCGTKDEVSQGLRADSQVWLSTGEAAEALGVTDRCVRKRCETGRLNAVRLGGRWLVDRNTLALKDIA